MNDLDTLDGNLKTNDISESLKKGFKSIEPWARFVAICNIVFQILYFIVAFFNSDRGVVGSFIAAAVNISLNVVLLQMAKEMKNLSNYGTVKDLSALLQKQLNYWFFSGVLLIIGLILFLLSVIAIA